MNKILLSIAALSLSFSAASQLRVLSNGHTQIGDWTNFSTSNRMMPDTTSTLAIMGPDNLCSGGSIAFGARNDVIISESVLTAPPVLSNSERSSMILRGMGGISYRSKKGIVFKYDVNNPLFDPVDPVETMIYYVNVKAPQFLTSSDSRFKKNIEGIEDSDKLLLDLTPVSYYLSIPRETEEEEIAKASAKNEVTNNKHKQYGFLAQEVREILPDLVFEDEDGMLSIDYNGFIPLLVDAYKNLKKEVKRQELLIETLSANQDPLRMKNISSIDGTEIEKRIELLQNCPNPFRTATEIRCTLPEEIKTAFICVFDLNGRQKQRFDLKERGETSITIDGNTLEPGMYIYTLVADGVEIDSKRMILTE